MNTGRPHPRPREHKTAKQTMQEAMSEADLQRAIVHTAHRHGWRVHHDPPVRVARRDGTFVHRTAVEGNPGFPDLVLARDGVVIIVECKAEHGRFEPGQKEWLEALGAKVCRPRDLDSLLARLGRSRVPTEKVAEGY